MSAMDRHTLRSLLQRMEKEAHKTLCTDGSFIEALQALKWQIDSDVRVRDAMSALRERGTSAFTSFVPRVCIRLVARKPALAFPQECSGSSFDEPESVGCVSPISSEPVAYDLRDAAIAAVASSPYLRQLDMIATEAVQANNHFRAAHATAGCAGYEVQIRVELSIYAQLRELRLTHAQSSRPRKSPAATRQSEAVDRYEPSRLRLSSPDIQFLKDLRISLDSDS